MASAELRRTTLLYEVGQKNDVDGYKSAMQLFNPYKEEWRDDLAKSIISDLRLQGNFYSDEEIFYGISELQKNVIEHPNNAYNHMLLGIFYTEMLPKDKKYLESANKEFEKALALSSKRQHIYFAMGRYYVLFGDIEGAKQMYQKAIDLEPNASVAYWEGGKNLLLMDESDELGEKLVIKAFEMGFQTGEKNEILFLFTKFSEKFLNEKKYKALAGLYENMQIVEPNNAKWSAQTAMSRYLEGDYVSALRAIEIAIEIDESYREEGEAFIKMIENHETNAKQ
ncbi:hypothetical protein L6259_03485 [Candidatus Parcubacteria bacterium]|nr:hypothetical protein [Candidatus Parcubacteria bacterium]